MEETTRARPHKIGVVSSTDTRALIERTLERFTAEVPALKQLKLVVRLELMARGGDAPIWRVEVPGPKVTKDPAGDAKLELKVGNGGLIGRVTQLVTQLGVVCLGELAVTPIRFHPRRQRGIEDVILVRENSAENLVGGHGHDDAG